MPSIDLPIELENLSLELAEQRAQRLQTFAGEIGNAIILGIGDCVEQVLDAVAPDRGDDTELGQVSAD